MDLGQAPTSLTQYPSLLSGGGELGELMRQIDWSRNPLGPVERWPQALKTAVRIMLTSRQPMFVWWGDELINLYNDAYKSIVGGKHPQSLGQPASVVWREIWDQVGPRAKMAMSQDTGTYDEALLLIMERHGYPEETYYTFSYSPVPNDKGGTGGILCANTDDTQRIIGERQLALLRELATRSADARTVDEACERSAYSLESNPRDLPFALIYLLDSDRRCAVLAGRTGIAAGHPAAQPTVALGDGAGAWPLPAVVESGRPVVVTDLPGALPAGAWPSPPSTVVALPIAASGGGGAAGVLVAGLNPYRLYDDSYQRFLLLVAGQISAAIANAQAYEMERRRAEALEELDRAKTAFFSNVSHEFRTPLTLLLGPLEEILAQPGGHEHELAQVAHRNALRLLKLVNTLLDFSRIEAGRTQARYRPTDFSAFTGDLASSFHSVMEKAGLRFRVDCPPLGQRVYLDSDLWEKIVLNLVSNAFKFTFEGEVAVEAGVSADGSAAELRVRDTGTGIAADEIPRLFERFHRVEGARGRTHEGTGIGLALVQELVKMHGGRVEVESRQGQGSVFTVSIPFGSSHLPRERILLEEKTVVHRNAGEAYVEEAERWLPERSAGEPERVPSAERHSVLLADDNADMREYVARLLAPHYRVITVSNGREAVEAALSSQPELVVSDVMMPVLDGFGMIRELRARAETRAIPVILLSARAGEEARIEGLQSGADDYLVKPFTARELLARVDTHLRMARLRQEAAQTLRAAEERLRLALESADLGTWDHDLVTGELTCSDRFKSMCGFRPDEAVSAEALNQRAHPDDRERSAREYREALAAQQETLFQSEFRLVLPDGSMRWVLSKGKPLFEKTSEGRRAIRVVGTLMDITEQKRSEESLREMQKLESLGLLAGGIAHDFNNLLTGVIGNASLLEPEFIPASPQYEAARALMEAAERMARLTGQMLAYSGRGRFIVEPVNLSMQVVQIVTLIQASIPKAVELRLSLDNQLPLIEADTSQLQQVLMNLVINAAEAINHDHGAVEVRTSVQEVGANERIASVTLQDAAPGRYAVLTVRDNGQGMDDATRARIFDPFFTTKFTGRGLGLAATLGIVRGHKGLLTVESRPGHGTTFRVFFPVMPVRQPAPSAPAPAMERGSGTVLVVDDEDLVRRTAQAALARAGYHVIAARDGREAVELFAAQRGSIDVVLLDMTMPTMGGEEAMRHLVKLQPDVAVLASSGYDEREAQQRFGSSIAGFLQKPYTAMQLVGKIGQVLRRR